MNSGAAGISSSSIRVESRLDLGYRKAASTLDKHRVEYPVETQDKVIFPELQKLRNVLELANTRLFVHTDEWPSLPLDIQPYLAEFLKRGLLPLTIATLKIGALEYRCRFSGQHDSGVLGFELGADIVTAPDLDDYFVFDRSPDQVTDTYADVLLNHLSSELSDAYLRDTYKVSGGRQLASRLSTEKSRLCRVSSCLRRRHTGFDQHIYAGLFQYSAPWPRQY